MNRPAPASANPPQTAAPAVEAAERVTRKDRERALTAYRWANEAKAAGRITEYETAVQGFAAALLRSGFAVAASTLERSRDRDGFRLLLDHLASWPLPGIDNGSGQDWPQRVRAMAGIAPYMQATRELVALLGWLCRACRAAQVEGEP
jgi:hypothetical protein